MMDFVAMLAVIGFLVGFYGLILCATAAKKTPKPGKDFDERGPYND